MLTGVMLTGAAIDAHLTGTYIEIDTVSTASDLVGYLRFGNLAMEAARSGTADHPAVEFPYERTTDAELSSRAGLLPGEMLLAGQSISTGRDILTMQADGNLVLYAAGRIPV